MTDEPRNLPEAQAAIAAYLETWPDNRLVELLDDAQAGAVHYYGTACLVGHRWGCPRVPRWVENADPLQYRAMMGYRLLGFLASGDPDELRCAALVPLVEAEMARRVPVEQPERRRCALCWKFLNGQLVHDRDCMACEGTGYRPVEQPETAEVVCVG